MDASNSHNTNAPKKILNSIAPHQATEPAGQQGMTAGPSMKKADTKSASVASPKIRNGTQNERHLSSRLKAMESTSMPAISKKSPPKAPRPWTIIETEEIFPWTTGSSEATSGASRNIPPTIHPMPKSPTSTDPALRDLDRSTARRRPRARARPASPRAMNAATKMLPKGPTL
jgi:hypothetical protein